MKKKLFAVLAATLAGATLSLSACTSGDSKITFNNYWNIYTEDTYTSNETIDETLTYDVSYKSGDNDSAINYEIDYDGEYITHLYSKPDAPGVYVFISDLDVAVTFTINGKSTTKKDRVHTEVHFHKAGGTNSMSPIYSYKEILSHSPVVTSSASTPDDCYTPYAYVFTTTYENGQGKCTSVQKAYDDQNNTYIDGLEFEQEFSFSASSNKRSVLDNEQFPVAFRAMPAGTDTTVQMFNPFLEKSQNYKVSLSSNTQEKKYTYTLNGNQVEPTIHYHTASIAVDGTTSGQPQTAEIATIQDAAMNTNRRIMLAYDAPLSHNIGVLKYELNTADYKGN